MLTKIVSGKKSGNRIFAFEMFTLNIMMKHFNI